MATTSKNSPSEKLLGATSIPFITAYGPKRKVSFSFSPGTGRTRQEFKAEADINVIMKRYERTGVLEYVQKSQGQYADITGLDYQAAMDTIAAARSAFEDLPAGLRLRFDNDPGELLDFLNDEDNAPEAEELGLLQPGSAAARTKAAALAAEQAKAETTPAAPAALPPAGSPLPKA